MNKNHEQSENLDPTKYTASTSLIKTNRDSYPSV